MAPPRVTALIDRSAYAASVCEHGAWLAERIGASLQLRHVREAEETVEAAKTLLTEASERLADNGATPPNLSLVEGGVLAAAISAEADVLALGKRGEGLGDDRAALGAHVEPILRALDIPVCLAAQVFLPIHRVLAVTDADPEHRAVLDLLTVGRGLDNLDLDLVVVARAGEDPEPKLDMARGVIEERAATFAIEAGGIGEAVWSYLASKPADLIVLSRAVLLGEGARSLVASAGSLWSARASVLIC